MKKIYELMSLTAEQYEQLIFKTYLRWCEVQAFDRSKDLQKLVANKRMFKFFMVQITGLEVDLREEMLPYVHLKDSAAMVKLWEKHCARIHCYYNDTIKFQARKINIINTINLDELRSIRN